MYTRMPEQMTLPRFNVHRDEGFLSTIASPPDRLPATMEPSADTALEVPEHLFKALSKAAVTNGRTTEEEIIARPVASLDRHEPETAQQH